MGRVVSDLGAQVVVMRCQPSFNSKARYIEEWPFELFVRVLGYHFTYILVGSRQFPASKKLAKTVAQLGMLRVQPLQCSLCNSFMRSKGPPWRASGPQGLVTRYLGVWSYGDIKAESRKSVCLDN